MLKLPMVLVSLAAALVPMSSVAQGQAATASDRPGSLSTFAASSDIEAMIARAKREIKPGAPLIVQPLLRFAPYTAFLEYRRGAWTAASHPDIEMFFVVRGSGTFISGGRMVDAKPAANGNVSGTDITGGTPRTVRQGDFFAVPAGTPHMFPKPDGELVLISMHIPGAPAH